MSSPTNIEYSLSLSKQGEIVQGADDIKQCIRIIATTPTGSDPLRPLFGCDAYKYLDLPINVALTGIYKELFESLEIWEERIENITFTHVLSDDGSNLIVRIKYDIKNTVNTDQADVTYNLKA
jgi:phage baseplate assembly protein W